MDAKVKTLIGLIPMLHDKKVTVQTLDGGLTNRNYCLKCGRDRFVLRITGENSRLLGIDRVAEHSCAKAAFAAGIGPEVVAFFPEHGVMVTRFVPGRVLVPEAIRTPAILQRVVASLRRYHEGTGGPRRFSAFATVHRYYTEARKRAVPFPPKIASALETLAGIEQAVGVPDRFYPCHNDLLPSNFVHNRRTIWILDWEYGAVGDLFFDLGNLAANSLFGHEEEAKLLQFYFGKTRPTELRRLRLMRLASDMREAMWGFLQMGISQLDFDYESYAHRHLRRFLKGAHRVAC